jgi:hypothetical protein
VPADEPADQLFALPAEEFVAARDALARDLRRAGRGEEAGAVLALRRPTRSAEALNHLARSRGDEVRRLLAEGDAMREALVAGDRGRLDAARTAATGEIGRISAGVDGGEAVRREVSDSLWAALADEQAAAALLAGRLERPLENPGLAGLAGLPPPPPGALVERGGAGPLRTAAVRRRRQAEQKVELARARVDDARAALERARHTLDVAERDLAMVEDVQTGIPSRHG